MSNTLTENTGLYVSPSLYAYIFKHEQDFKTSSLPQIVCIRTATFDHSLRTASSAYSCVQMRKICICTSGIFKKNVSAFFLFLLSRKINCLVPYCSKTVQSMTSYKSIFS